MVVNGSKKLQKVAKSYECECGKMNTYNSSYYRDKRIWCSVFLGRYCVSILFYKNFLGKVFFENEKWTKINVHFSIMEKYFAEKCNL